METGIYVNDVLSVIFYLTIWYIIHYLQKKLTSENDSVKYKENISQTDGVEQIPESMQHRGKNFIPHHKQPARIGPRVKSTGCQT